MKFLSRFCLPCRARVLVQALFAALATKTALAIPSKAARCVKQIGAIYPYAASFDLGGDVQRQVDIVAPHAGRQSIARVIGQRDSFFRSSKGHRNQHRSEYPNLRDVSSRGNLGKNRGREEVALGWAGP